MDAFIDLFITLCIVINTAFMAIDHYGMDKQLTETLRIGNYVSIEHICFLWDHWYPWFELHA